MSQTIVRPAPSQELALTAAAPVSGARAVLVLLGAACLAGIVVYAVSMVIGYLGA